MIAVLMDGGFLYGDCLTVTGKSINENPKNKFEIVLKILFIPQKPLSKTGGVVGLKGNLAPDGAIVKVAGLKSTYFEGKALCFNSEEEALTRSKQK